MQIVESYQAVSSQHFLIDEIYAPSLNNAVPNAKAFAEEQQHLKAINELHRFFGIELRLRLIRRAFQTDPATGH